jgi:hypothetical protein
MELVCSIAVGLVECYTSVQITPLSFSPSVLLCEGDPMATVLVEDQVEIPGNVATLTAFRRWALSESFPKRGRIDWVGSQIEVDMSPEDLFTHGTLKTEIVRVLCAMAKSKGYNLFTGETRISSIAGNLSAEPDVVAVSDAAIDTDRVRLTPKAGGEAGRFGDGVLAHRCPRPRA